MPDRAGLPFEDSADFEAAERGLIDAGDPVIRNEAGDVVWDNGSYSSFLTGDAPDTVHPSLWRQSTLVAQAGPVRGHRRASTRSAAMTCPT